MTSEAVGWDMKATVVVERLTISDYSELQVPYGPGTGFPELGFLENPTDGYGGEVYRAVRSMLKEHYGESGGYGTTDWNPFGRYADPGDRVVVHPNWVRHFNGNERGSLDSVVTHPSVYRPLVDYALKAVGPDGEVLIADAPQMDCQFDVLGEYLEVEALVSFYRDQGLPVDWRDLRDETVVFEDGLVKERTQLNGDPEGYEIVDLGERSAFESPEVRGGVTGDLDHDRLRAGLSSNGDGDERSLLRGADYDEEETIRHHSGGRNEYKVSKTILSADLIINAPKIKTHKKAGVTLAMKNLVGINCNKNFLPHHRAGSPDEGGDEFPGGSLYQRFRSWAIELVRPLLKEQKFTPLLSLLRRFDLVTRPEKGIRSGNWHGNDTIWRTIVDLNRILHYADADGEIHDERQRKVLHLFEGIVAAGGEGPMAGDDVPLGILALSEDPVAGDLVVCQLMGFDWRKIPKIRAALAADDLQFTDIEGEADVTVVALDDESGDRTETSLPQFDWNFGLRPHYGWEGYLELEADGTEAEDREGSTVPRAGTRR